MYDSNRIENREVLLLKVNLGLHFITAEMAVALFFRDTQL